METSPDASRTREMKATVSISGIGVSASYAFNATFGIVPYEATYDSVYAHESPSWYNDLKCGILIHWGVHSVPAGGNVAKKEFYAEWYWWDQNQGPNQTTETYQYDLATYGPDHVYDDFIQNFTADAFDPKAWVGLFADAGASYFVQVSKHHDGYAIFDLPANVSLRTSVAQFPHRNPLKELFDAAAQYQPHLHRGAYFSLPEWLNPAYAPYGFAQWPGGNAKIRTPMRHCLILEMNTLAEMGTEVMWCDIGGPNLTAEFASAWFNTAADQSRQVVMDNRCGLPGDFDTPEYARYDAVQIRKWESNLGMDPFPYGYNRATPDSAYLKAVDIVTSLIDIVSKNGNFLLDVGPQANGTIIAIEQQNLRQAGMWIKSHGEAIFNTTYWFVAPQDGTEIRFTQTMDAFYITALSKPNATIVLESPVPWVQGDKVTVFGGNASGTVVPSQLTATGSLQLTIPEAVQNADQYAWVFKISYGGTSSNATGTTTPRGNGTSSAPSGTSGPVAFQGVGGVSKSVNMLSMLLSAAGAVAVTLLL
ncbi:hypothetical protein B0A49_05638 [Cryomyces minteri]|uniref:alpha-L-fucosidase n=1 Tax=Cryomyces minteri TaxID=331657 RepID=A0A4U0XHD1_9PEZI|nr:hypothetical protein B0A49_05638 [Cryomyces minteri]